MYVYDSLDNKQKPCTISFGAIHWLEDSMDQFSGRSASHPLAFHLHHGHCAQLN